MSTQAEWTKSIEEREAAFRANIAYYGLTKTLVYKNDQEGWHWELHCKCCPKGVQDSSMKPFNYDVIAVGVLIGVVTVVVVLNVFTNFSARW